MPAKVKPIPEGYHTLTPYIVVRDAGKAIEYYKQALGAKEVMRMNMPDGRVAHAELKIGDSFLMISDEYPEHQSVSPQSLGGSPAVIHMYVEDADAVFDRAVKQGATVRMPVMEAFWGDRYGMFIDPFGHIWGVSTHVKDMTPEEIEAAGREAMSQQARKQAQ